MLVLLVSSYAFVALLARLLDLVALVLMLTDFVPRGLECAIFSRAGYLGFHASFLVVLLHVAFEFLAALGAVDVR